MEQAVKTVRIGNKTKFLYCLLLHSLPFYFLFLINSLINSYLLSLLQMKKSPGAATVPHQGPDIVLGEAAGPDLSHSHPAQEVEANIQAAIKTVRIGNKTKILFV